MSKSRPERGLQQKVAVIVPVYNNARYLKACLGAIKPDIEKLGWELIVVDDASTDDSPRIAEQFGARVIRLKKNRGVAAARNVGGRLTSAEVLIFVDADIVPEPGALRAMVDILRTRPDIHAVGAYPLPGDLSSQWSAHFVGLRSAWGFDWAEEERERPFSSIQSECGAVRRWVFDKLGGFSQQYRGVGMEEFKMAHDMEKCGYGHYLIRGAAYRHYYKPLLRRCPTLFERTSRWVPLLLKRKNFESRGGFGTARAALSCLLSFLALVALVLAGGWPGFLIAAGLFWLAQLGLEARFLGFAKQMYGWPMVFYSVFALQLLHLAIGIGFIWGLVRVVAFPHLLRDLQRE